MPLQGLEPVEHLDDQERIFLFHESAGKHDLDRIMDFQVFRFDGICIYTVKDKIWLDSRITLFGPVLWCNC